LKIKIKETAARGLNSNVLYHQNYEYPSFIYFYFLEVLSEPGIFGCDFKEV
jgi:hypothetical protein